MFAVFSLKSCKQHVELSVRKFFFTKRIISAWNDLPESVIQCQSASKFKRQLDCHIELIVDKYKLLFKLRIP